MPLQIVKCQVLKSKNIQSSYVNSLKCHFAKSIQRVKIAKIDVRNGKGAYLPPWGIENLALDGATKWHQSGWLCLRKWVSWHWTSWRVDQMTFGELSQRRFNNANILNRQQSEDVSSKCWQLFIKKNISVDTIKNVIISCKLPRLIKKIIKAWLLPTTTAYFEIFQGFVNSGYSVNGMPHVSNIQY